MVGLLYSSQLSLALGGAILFVIQRGTLLLLHTPQHSKWNSKRCFLMHNLLSQ